MRIVIGRAPLTVNDDGSLTVPQAKEIAKRWNIEADAGRDPRAVKLERAAADAEKLAQVKARKARPLWQPHTSRLLHRRAAHGCAPGGNGRTPMGRSGFSLEARQAPRQGRGHAADGYSTRPVSPSRRKPMGCDW